LTLGDKIGLPGPGNPVGVVWVQASAVLTVTYNREDDFFALDDKNKAQGSKLLKADASGNLQEVSGVTTKIIAT